MQQGHSQPAASVSEVRDEIQTISQSRLFAQSGGRIRLLEYLCDMVLLGRQDEIKETTIALEVFDRTIGVRRQKGCDCPGRSPPPEGAAGEILRDGWLPRPANHRTRARGLHPTVHRPTPAKPEPAAGGDWPIRRSGIAWFRASLEDGGSGASLCGFRPRRCPGAFPPRPRCRAHPGRCAAPGPVAPPTAAIRILAGSTKPLYRPCRPPMARRTHYFTGGVAQPGPTDFLGRPADPSLYRTMRYGDFSYSLPAPPGVYELWLHFAEPNYRGGNRCRKRGRRKPAAFFGGVNGAALLHDFDVVNDTGSSPVDVRVFRDITPAADGMVHLQFQAVSGQPFVNAIELVPGSGTHPSDPDPRRRRFVYRSCRQRLEPGQLLYRRTARHS